MSTKEKKIFVEKTTTALLKPTTAIAQNLSNSCVKLMELTEYCNLAEDYLKECEEKIESLNISKSEREKLRIDLLQRNKINAINSESLLQAKNELYKYKSDLKLEYITTKRTVKSRRLKFKKILSFYEASWEKTLEKYNLMPDVIELRETQKQVANLEVDIERHKKLEQTTLQQFSELKKNIEKKFLEKIIEFAQTVKSITSKEKRISKEAQEKPAVQLFNARFNFLHSKMKFVSNGNSLTTQEEIETHNVTPIDVSVFDNLSIPSDHLENQNDEELFMFTSNDTKKDEKIEDTSGVDLNVMEIQNDQEKSPEYFSEEKEIEQTPSKIGTESQYFALEKHNKTNNNYKPGQRKVTKAQVRTEGYYENFDENSEPVIRKIKLDRDGMDEEIQKMGIKGKKGLGVEIEESLSDGSFDNQESKRMESNDNFELQRTESSGEISPQLELNSSGNNRNDLNHHSKMDVEETNVLKLENEDNSKHFGGFFSMETDTSFSKPSIFKLF